MAELEELISTPRRLRLSLACSALLAGGAIALAAAEWRTAPALLGLRPPVGLQSRPNLLFVAADGIEAEVLSAYGYSRDTSPQIQKLAKESLVAENAFVHAGKTTGSTTALLTGMLPSHSKVAYPPQILSRELAFQHLPALLRSEGYRGFQRSMRHYADSADINLRAAFEQANGRTVRSAHWPPTLQRAAHVLNAEIHFFERSWERLESRLLHLLWIRRMDDPFLTVKVNRGLGVAEDRKTIDEAIAYIDSAPTQPFFMHLHLMATHCCRYRGGTPFFRPGPKLSPELSARLNLIRDVDAEIGRLVDHLRARGILENTIVVVSSDHSARWDSLQRVPLIIRFPNGRHRRRVKSNVGFVDVAPTLLDALGLPIPDWMDGHSLLADTDSKDPISPTAVLTVPEFSYRQFKLKGMGHLSQMTDPGPPLYGFKSFASIQCNVWHKLELATGQMTSGEVPGHTGPCAASSLSGPDEARQRILEHLEAQGFTIPRAR
jgi:arylsulfatase A-like enzyme